MISNNYDLEHPALHAVIPGENFVNHDNVLSIKIKPQKWQYLRINHRHQLQN
jgi:hypothetical protein